MKTISLASQDFDQFKPTDEYNQILASLSPDYLSLSEMTPEERQFLNGLVRRCKPTKVLEIGVSAGSSSVILLNALKDNPRARLYSHDYSRQYYQDETKLSGFIVDDYPQLKDKWQLLTGGLVLNYLPQIGPDIDFCFIDAAHMNPGEILDTIMVLPYLKDDAVVVYHDVNLPTFRHRVNYDIHRTLTNNLLMSALHGRKIVQADFDWRNDPRTHFPNMGAIQLNQDSKKHLFNLFNLLTLKWSYCPSEEEQAQLRTFLLQHYDEYYADYVDRVFAFHRPQPHLNKQRSLKTIIKRTAEATLGPRRAAAIKNKLAKKQVWSS